MSSSFIANQGSSKFAVLQIQTLETIGQENDNVYFFQGIRNSSERSTESPR
jgi:hypothetical protein